MTTLPHPSYRELKKICSRTLMGLLRPPSFNNSKRGAGEVRRNQPVTSRCGSLPPPPAFADARSSDDVIACCRLPSITADPTGRGIERWIRTSGPGWRAEGAPHGMFTTTKRIGRALMNTSGNARNLPLLRRDGYQFPDKSTQLVGYQHQMACRS